jgi:rod shape-determining protein MreC
LGFFNFDLKKILIYALLILLPFLSIRNQQTQSKDQWYDKPFSWLASEIQGLFFNFSEGIRLTVAEYVNLIDIKKQNKDLQSKVSEMQTRIQMLDEIKIENSRYREILDFKKNTPLEILPAEVIAHNNSIDHKTVQINKGESSGIKNFMPVITTEGVAGYILQTQARSSTVLLITDRYAVVDGIVQRSRSRGIVEGNGTNCLLRYVEKSEDVQKGDLVVTSGIDKIFPKGFPIARVSSVEKKNSSVSLLVTLDPVVHPSKLEQVFVLTKETDWDLEVQNKVTDVR